MMLPSPKLHSLDERLVDVGPLGLEEAASWTEFVEEKQLLLPADLAVIPLGGFLL